MSANRDTDGGLNQGASQFFHFFVFLWEEIVQMIFFGL